MLIEVDKKAIGTHPWASPRRIGRARCRRSFLPIRFDLKRSFSVYFEDPENATGPDIKKILIKHNKGMKALDIG